MPLHPITLNRSRSPRGLCLSLGLVLGLALAAAAAPARAASITTWNLQHMMSEAIFDEWAAFCSKYGWNEDKVKAAGVRKPGHLTYCNAHDGLLYPTTIPESRPLHDRAAFAAKLAQLASRRDELNSDIFALQEVSDAAAVHRLFPASDWEVVASRAAISQNIAFAVRKKSALRIVATRQIDGLAQSDDSGHLVRPGLEMTVELAGRRLTLLNVHLKASCRSQPLSAPNRPGYADDARWAEIQQGCKVMRKQAPELENWMESQTRAKALFMIVGDWNRDLRRDLSMPARLNEGEDPRSPIKPETRIGSLLKEISDNEPQGAWLAAVFPKITARKKTVRGPDQTKPDSVCHEGIDNFALSDSLMKTLKLRKEDLTATGTDYGAQAYGVDKAMPSDHCPVTLHLDF